MSAATEATAPVGNRFVVLVMGLGNLKRGTVFTRQDLPPAVTDERMQELLQMQTIRPARPEEEGHAHVTLVNDPDKHLSFDTMFVEKERELDAARVQLTLLQSKIRDLETRGAPVLQPAVQPPEASVLIEKDAMIENLQRQVKELQGQLKGQGKK